ncbi:MAG: PKD domain-containing protein [Rhodothermales bacterium]
MKQAFTAILPCVLFIAIWALAGCDSQYLNEAPKVEAILASPATGIAPGSQVSLTVVAVDVDGDSLNYFWNASGGKITNWSWSNSITNPTLWIAPDQPGSYTITCYVSDDRDMDSTSLSITVE